MRGQTGIIIITEPGRPERTLPTFTCPHCMRVGLIGSNDGSWCFKCDRLTCKSPACIAYCQPFQHRLELAIRSQINRREI